ncbi:MAG: hypothetical protein NZ581_02985 [Candidatus Caldarchaeum sp.]|nr:hypothetical protein [Candidatus Caldarchaeum sp.]MDW8435149.1 hypothetical protein [Candidatus Caldarchaeum sp.]
MRKTALILSMMVLSTIVFAATPSIKAQQEFPWHEPVHFLGPQTTLVLLVDFTDVKMRISTRQAEQIVKLVDDFIRRSSYGKTWLDYYIHPKIITLPKPMSYYGGPPSGAQRGDDPNRIVEYHLTIIKLAKERERIDLTRFKHVIVIHAGKDEAVGGTANDIWSHCYSTKPIYFLIEEYGFDAAERQLRTWGADWAVDLFMHRKPDGTGHLIAGIETVAEEDMPSVMMHEFTHSMWIADHYVYDKDGYSAGSEVGVWTNMDYGSALEPPVDIDGWSKYLLGWVEAVEVTRSGEYIIHMLDKPDEPHALIIPINDREYYFLHARRPVGQDAALPGPGILLFRVNKYVRDNVVDQEYFIRLLDAHPETPNECGALERRRVRLCEGVDAPFFSDEGFRRVWEMRTQRGSMGAFEIGLLSSEYTTEEGYYIKVLEVDVNRGTVKVFVGLEGQRGEEPRRDEAVRTVTRTVTGTVEKTVYTTVTAHGRTTETVVVTVTVKPPPRETSFEDYVSLAVVLAALLMAVGLMVGRRRVQPRYPPPPPPPHRRM